MTDYLQKSRNLGGSDGADTVLDDLLIFSLALPPLPPPEMPVRSSGGLGGLGGLGGVRRMGNTLDEEILFRRKLLAFARRRKIAVNSNGAWFFAALHTAASEHPDLDIRKRKRGRPQKIEMAGLLAALFGGLTLSDQELEAERLVRRIDAYNAKLKQGQKKITDARLAELHAEKLNTNNPSLVPSAKHKWAKLFSAARKRMGVQKRGRVIPE